MTTHIKNAEYRRFWEARYAHHQVRLSTRDFATNYCCAASICADDDLSRWSLRFADPETLADIEANGLKRGQG